VLDLRETASGGNTTVARSIIGHFISKEGFYQKHELVAEQTQYGVKRSWVEIVSPKKPLYSKPLVLLVDHWTGSVGEGITIGFDAFKRAKIIGTEMARLNGAVYSYKMPNTGIGFSFPVEKLYHVNGVPRERFVPQVKVDMQRAGDDPILLRALEYLKTR
jgi:C-terminal processing protease CtpA/Prc